ncbi:MAG: hypothetical protein H6737_16135 [Alphaproteobacteria bacterium]|nr:hypothetical protein [Alphaproteobacteria bacterium]
MRIAILTLGILGLTACYDFAGERGKLGFDTDATLDGTRPWTPETPLAEGARPRLAVSEILAKDAEPEGPATFDGSRSIALHRDEDHVVVEGSGRAWIGAEADGVRDDLHLRWAKAAGGVLVDPIAAMIGEQPVLTEVLLVEGGTESVGYAVLDARGDLLGHVPEQLDIRTGDALAVDVESGGRLALNGVTPGVTDLVVQWPGARPTTVHVEVIAAEAIDGIRVERHLVAGECGLRAVLTSDGVPVRGATGFVWSHDDTREPYAPCATDVGVRWGDLAATP